MIIDAAEQVEQTPVEQELQEAPATPAESPEQKLDGLLEAGASRMEHEPVNPQPEQEEPPAPEQASEEPAPQSEGEEMPLEAPAHWSEDRRREFEGLPPAAQKILTARHKEMERGYNDKFQALANERTQLSAWQQLTQRIQADPQFAQHVFSYGQQAEQPQPEGPPVFDDPVQELEYNAAQRAREEVLKELDPTLKQQQNLQTQVERQAAIAHFRSDPRFAEVDVAVKEYVDQQPTQEMRDHLSTTLLSDLKAYGNIYSALRQNIAQKAAQPVPPAQPAPKQRKVTQREAPKLEDAGGPVNVEGANRSKRLSALTKKIKSNSAGLDDLGEYFDMTARF